ncbi:MAG: peptide-methionine (S)-S-oxide reductase MsrA [Actinomycetota bacterium]|nr:peptide-methionine (S)-S-oxide reductase MsrA [Actinomycetota bacterium]
MKTEFEEIVLGGGCFWCIEAVLNTLDGVVEAVPGYGGGHKSDPAYEEVCGGSTGHAEVVRVRYDTRRISLEDLLEVFFSAHDPTSLNRQGLDVGTQYRSIILYNTGEQKEIIEGFLDGIGSRYASAVVTEVRRLERFYPAEEYHHRYYERNPHQPYCRVMIKPKLEKLGKKPV